MENNNPIGIYGWRKRCLYAFLTILSVIILINISLTVWILVVLQFNVHGMGTIRITDGGIQVNGEAEFLDTLYTESITSNENVPLMFKASRNITLSVNNQTKMELGSSGIKLTSPELTIESNKAGSSSPLIYISANGSILLGANNGLFFNGEQVVVEGSLRADSVSSIDKDLLLSSINEGLVINGGESLFLESRQGDIDLLSNSGNLILNSTNGMVEINAANIYLKAIPLSTPFENGHLWPDVYHLCVCPSGKLYRVLASNDTMGNSCAIPQSASVC